MMLISAAYGEYDRRPFLKCANTPKAPGTVGAMEKGEGVLTDSEHFPG